MGDFFVLHAHAHPDVLAPGEISAQFCQAFGPFRENLENQVRIVVHHSENLLDELQADILVEQIAHRVHENHRGFVPRVGNGERRLVLTELETVLVFFDPHRLQTPRHDLRVAEFAPCGNLVAARGRIPREFGPFDGAACHGLFMHFFDTTQQLVEILPCVFLTTNGTKERGHLREDLLVFEIGGNLSACDGRKVAELLPV